MWSLEQISTDFKAADLAMKELSRVSEGCRSHYPSAITFAQQWIDLHSSFSSIVDSLCCRINVLDSIVQSIDNRERGLELKQRELVSVEKSISDREVALEDVQNSIDGKNKELEVKQKELDALEKSLNERCRELELKEKKLREISDVRVESDELCHELEADASLRFHVTMNGEALQMFLNDRFSEHDSLGDEVYSALKLSNDPARLILDAMDGFFPPHLKKGNVEYEANIVRSTCVLMLEQLLKMKPLIKEHVRDEARDLAFKWREKIQQDGGSNLVVLGFLLLVTVYSVASSFDRTVLLNLLGTVDKNPQAPILRRRLDLLEKSHVNDESSQPTVEKPHVEALQVATGVSSSFSAPVHEINLICANMDGKYLRKYLIKHARDGSMLSERVLDALRFAPDPAELVFDVTQSFYTSDSKKENKINKTSCILLLGLLMKLSLDITPSMKEHAIMFADSWRKRLEKEGNVPLHVFGFLQFLAAYKLASCFDACLLLSLFGNLFDETEVFWVEQQRNLCHALGLANKIPDLIMNLINKNKWLQAVRCICALNMVDNFRPVSLLEAYLAFVNRSARMKRRKFRFKRIADIQLIALRRVLKCISDYKLHDQFSLTDIEQRIEMLEKDKRKIESVALDETERKKRKEVA